MNQLAVNNKRPLFALLLLVVCVTLVRIFILSANTWPVNGDETQYWSWAKHLAWGYYSKPPMVAWLIALTTKLFGNGITAMRLASPLTHAVTALMLYLVGTRLFNSRIGFWSGLTYILMPGVSFSSTIISTDPPLLMFLSIAFYGFIRAIEKNQVTWWVFTGCALGLAMLSKYAALFFPISMLLFFVSSTNYRSQLKKPGPYLALIIMGILLIPNLMWNYNHHFAAIMAVKDNANLHHMLWHPMNMWAFIGSQFAIFGPILFIGLLIMLWQLPKLWRLENYKLLFCFIIPLLLIMTLEALLSRAHANWSAPIYVAASIAVSAYIIESKKLYWLVVALILNLIVILGLVNIQAIVRTLGLTIHQQTTIVNWQQRGKQIENYRHHYPRAKVLVDNRMLLTEIMYFGQVPLKDTFTWDPRQVIKSQYDLVTHIQTQKGKNFLLFSYEKQPQNILSRFKKVKSLPTINLISLDGRELAVYAYYMQDFMGY